jgi:hypothetical protein
LVFLGDPMGFQPNLASSLNLPFLKVISERTSFKPRYPLFFISLLLYLHPLVIKGYIG